MIFYSLLSLFLKMQLNFRIIKDSVSSHFEVLTFLLELRLTFYVRIGIGIELPVYE